jgi:hypothetical protein
MAFSATPDPEHHMRTLVRSAIFAARDDADIFGELTKLLDRDCATNKARGDVFECLCAEWMRVRHRPTCTDVWRLADVPADVLTALKLKRQDMGIDLVARDAAGRFYAVQAKYRKKARVGRTRITWKGVATFLALCATSGPWARHVVVTTADYVRWGARGRSAQERVVAAGTWSSLPREFWYAVAGFRGRTVADGGASTEAEITETGALPPPDSDAGRALRLARFG